MPLIDSYGRNHRYLRISITDACNLSCIYCKPQDSPETGSFGSSVSRLPEDSIPTLRQTPVHRLSSEHALAIAQLAARSGFRKVRITGGEPLVHPELVNIVRGVAAIPGIEDVSITTNGTLLKDQVQELKQAGLRRINISLDSLDPDTYTRITRGGNLKQVLAGIEASLAAGLDPVKINVVLLKGINDKEIPDFLHLARDYPLHVRFIECMPFVPSAADLFIPAHIVLERAREAGIPLHPFPRADTGTAGGEGPAELYRIPGARGHIGLIHPITRHFCSTCNRLRVTPEGSLRPCLLKDREVPLSPILSNPEDALLAFQEALSEALNEKEASHTVSNLAGSSSKAPGKDSPISNLKSRMYSIGG
ncbi:MAG: GTP 3',8-cyclase MoaA [Spirochaetales bacterium]